MRGKTINSFDLNLLKVFLAVWDMRNLTEAGERLGLTQPAVSHSLRRLREHFSDPLFTRFGTKMIPTETAMTLHPAFERALQVVSHSIQQSAAFSPETSSRTFRLGMSDVSELCFLPRLLAHMEKIAPMIRIESTEVDVETIDTKMRSGQVDIAIGYLPELANYNEVLLTEDHFICLVRKHHPFRQAELSMADLSSLTYVDSLQATGYRMIARHLHLQGVRRSINARLAHFTVVPEIVRRTDMATLYPLTAAEIINADGAFRILSLPVALPKIPINLYTHPNFSNDRGIEWLCEIIKSAAESTEGNGQGDVK